MQAGPEEGPLSRRIPRRRYSLPVSNDRAALNWQTNTMSKLRLSIGLCLLLSLVRKAAFINSSTAEKLERMEV